MSNPWLAGINIKVNESAASGLVLQVVTDCGDDEHFSTTVATSRPDI